MNENIKSNLLRLRVSTGKSQQEIAIESDISLLAYRNIESGESEPSVKTLEKLANVFNVNIEEFFKEYSPNIKAVRFRALEDKNIKKREEIIFTVADWLEEFNNLLSKLSEEGKYKFKLSHLEKQDYRPIEMAAEARDQLQIAPDEPIRDICSLLEYRGGIIVYTKEFFSDSFFGLSLIDNNKSRVIVVNTWSKISIERRKYTVAHELGHLLLHPNSYEEQEKEENKEEEKQADVFASHFLMPQDAFINEWNKYNNYDFVEKVIKIKQTFGVSYQVVLYRLSEIIKENKISFNVWKEFNKLYMAKYNVILDRKNEVIPMNENLKELQSLSSNFYYGRGIAELVRKAYTKKIINLDEAAHILKKPIEEVKNQINLWKIESQIPILNTQ